MWKRLGKTKEPENLGKAYDYAVFLLSLRLRTEGEIKDKMKNRGYSSDSIEKTIQRLKSQKYLDDERYAEIFVDNLKKYKTFGFYGIKKKLMEKKLPPNIINRALEEGLPMEEEIKIGERWLKKNVFAGEAKQLRDTSPRSSKGLLAMTKKQKLAAKLKSRGFRGEVIAKLVF